VTVREILLWPDARLREVCDPVPDISDEIQALVSDLFDTMYDAKGRGLAAPQIGVLQRVFVMDAGWKEGRRRPLAMINPMVLHSSAAQCDIEEACLSIPGVSATVRRPEDISVLWTDPDGTQQTRDFNGVQARIIQHEVAHLFGQVIFDALSPEDGAALETRYLAGRA